MEALPPGACVLNWRDGDSPEHVARHWNRIPTLGSPVKPFGYLKDPLFVLAVAVYSVNRWMLKPVVSSAFLHGHFNDLFLIPAALPPQLWIQSRLRLRPIQFPPGWGEMLFHLAVWSVICEGIGPLWMHRGTADPWDVVAYAIGGVASCLWWRRARTPTSEGRDSA